MLRTARPDCTSRMARSWPLPLVVPFTIGFLESVEITSHGKYLWAFGFACWAATSWAGYRLLVWWFMALPGSVQFSNGVRRDHAVQVYEALAESDYAGLANEVWASLADASIHAPRWFNPLAETAIRAAGKRPSMVSKSTQIETLMELLKDAEQTSRSKLI